ncbi:hypothetical protein BN2364_2389 [Alloalcanivorax xenomutans]|jgi:hypothetical protein|nr:hypothetical protein BN2364_2389 [Alloalcanivorax xenomutans]
MEPWVLATLLPAATINPHKGHNATGGTDMLDTRALQRSTRTTNPAIQRFLALTACYLRTPLAP